MTSEPVIVQHCGMMQFQNIEICGLANPKDADRNN